MHLFVLKRTGRCNIKRFTSNYTDPVITANFFDKCLVCELQTAGFKILLMRKHLSARSFHDPVKIIGGAPFNSLLVILAEIIR